MHPSLQVLVLVKFVVDFISSNPFIVCSDELSFIKKQLYRDRDDIKVKQKAGVVQYKAYQGGYVTVCMHTIIVLHHQSVFRSVLMTVLYGFFVVHRYFIDFTLTVPNEYPAKHVM